MKTIRYQNCSKIFSLNRCGSQHAIIHKSLFTECINLWDNIDLNLKSKSQKSFVSEAKTYLINHS